MKILIFENHLFQQVLTDANGYKIPIKKEKGIKSREAEGNIQKAISSASLPQYSLYNRNEKAVYENDHTDEMLRRPHPSVQRSENTLLR